MLVRFRVVGLAPDDGYPFPLTQNELAEAVGLTPVHVNRTLQQLRADGLVEFRGKLLTVKDPAGLKRLGRFSSNYLHLRRTEAGDAEVAARAGDLV